MNSASLKANSITRGCPSCFVYDKLLVAMMQKLNINIPPCMDCLTIYVIICLHTYGTVTNDDNDVGLH